MIDNHAYSHRRWRYTVFLNQELFLFVAEVFAHNEASATVNGFRLVGLHIEPKHFYQFVSDRLRLSEHLHIWLRLELMPWRTCTMLIRRRLTVHRLAFVGFFSILFVAFWLTVSRFII